MSNPAHPIKLTYRPAINEELAALMDTPFAEGWYWEYGDVESSRAFAAPYEALEDFLRYMERN